MITVAVNGEPREVASGTTLAQLIESLGHESDAVATAVDGEFVPRAARDSHTLHPGVRIACFQPIVGG